MWIILVLAVGSSIACLFMKGADQTLEIFLQGLNILANLAPKIGAGLLLSGALVVLLPRDKVARWVGSDSGLRGLVVATLAGCVTPGGPWTAFPIAGAIAAVGADKGVMVAYLASWMSLGLNRVLVWEIPVMGEEFAITRLLISFSIPILAGLLARFLWAALGREKDAEGSGA